MIIISVQSSSITDQARISIHSYIYSLTPCKCLVGAIPSLIIISVPRGMQLFALIWWLGISVVVPDKFFPDKANHFWHVQIKESLVWCNRKWLGVGTDNRRPANGSGWDLGHLWQAFKIFVTSVLKSRWKRAWWKVVYLYMCAKLNSYHNLNARAYL